jgi:hypothetical protein
MLMVPFKFFRNAFQILLKFVSGDLKSIIFNEFQTLKLLEASDPLLIFSL